MYNIQFIFGWGLTLYCEGQEDDAEQIPIRIKKCPKRVTSVRAK
jgi:hypothetical protein